MCPNMKTSLSLLLLAIVTQASPPCDWFTTARSQQSFPVLARQTLYNLHHVDQLCKQSLHRLPLSSLPLVSFFMPENKDTVGTFLQIQGAKLEDFLMGNWARNYSRDIVKFKWDSGKMTEKALDVISWQINSVIGSIEKLKSSNNIDPQDVNIAVSILQTFKEQDFVTILDALSCTLTRSNSSDSDLNLKEIGKMMNAVGWEKLDDEKLESELAKLENHALNEAMYLLEKCLERMTDFLLSFTEEMKEYENTLLQVQSGNSPKLENLIINILEEAKFREFPLYLDGSFADACAVHRSKTIWKYLEKTITRLVTKFGFLRESISRNDKVDVLILVTELNSNLGELTEEVLNIFGGVLNDLRSMLKDKGNAKWMADRFLTIFYPAECNDYQACQQEKLLLADKVQILVGGILRAFVKHVRVNRFSSNGDCGIDCSADCSDLKREWGEKLDFTDDRQGRWKRVERCWSKEGCNKNLFYDPECQTS